MSRFLNHMCIHVFQNKINSKLQLCLIGSAISGHALYSYGTYNTNIITIHKKYNYTKNANTEFMVIDKKGNHYNMNNNFWYWKWNSIEDWHKYKENDSIKIKYYGYRVQLLGFFPNIVHSQNTSDITSSPVEKNNSTKDNVNYNLVKMFI